MCQCMENTWAYIFAYKSGFAQSYPQVNKTREEDSSRKFSMDWEIPRYLIIDGAIEQFVQNIEFIKGCRTYDIILHVSRPRQRKKIPQRESSEKFARNGSD